MNGNINECVNERMNGNINECVNERMNGNINECVDEIAYQVNKNVINVLINESIIFRVWFSFSALC